MRKVHLGCGSNYIDGWINIDIDSPLADIAADLRHPLPFEDASVDLVFNEHFLEHLSREQGLAFLRECRRILKPGGMLRISTPDLRWLCAQYVCGQLDEWRDVGWLPDTSCSLMNEGMRLWEHQFVYDRDELQRALGRAGFGTMVHVPHRRSAVAELTELECRPYHHELIVEATV
jgi:predicted SAM-dependent methyltransferase